MSTTVLFVSVSVTDCPFSMGWTSMLVVLPLLLLSKPAYFPSNSYAFNLVSSIDLLLISPVAIFVIPCLMWNGSSSIFSIDSDSHEGARFVMFIE